jgi:hypothetical protein
MAMPMSSSFSSWRRSWIVKGLATTSDDTSIDSYVGLEILNVAYPFQ